MFAVDGVGNAARDISARIRDTRLQYVLPRVARNGLAVGPAVKLHTDLPPRAPAETERHVNDHDQHGYYEDDAGEDGPAHAPP